MARSIKQWVNSQVLNDYLPFNIDFEVQPPKDDDQPTESVGGFVITQQNDLLSREAWWFETIEQLSSKRRQEAIKQLQDLARLLAEEVDPKKVRTKEQQQEAERNKRGKRLTVNEAMEQLQNPSDELLNSDEYGDFLTNHQDKLNQLNETLRLVQNDRALNWLKVGFFLLSRYSENWELGHTAMLKEWQIQEILQFINREANGGIEPEPEETDANEEGQQGELPVSSETGENSTGNAKKSQPATVE